MRLYKSIFIQHNIFTAFHMTHSKHELLLCLLLFSSVAYAQLGNPREKFGIAATVDGASNTDYYWKSNDGETLEEGRLKHGINAHVRANLRLLGNRRISLSLSPFYHFSNRELRVNTTSTRIFDTPSEHHHYGGSLTATYNTLLANKPLTIMALGTGNFSQYGYENASGMAGAVVSITRSQRTHFALGAIYLLGTSVSWPLYPMFIYTHRFDNRWSISCLETNNYLYYQASPSIKYAIGMEIETNKFYLRPKTEGLPKKAEISQISERFGLFANIQATKELTCDFGLGITFPFYGRLRESGYNHTYMKIHDSVKPFLKCGIKYSLTH